MGEGHPDEWAAYLSLIVHWYFHAAVIVHEGKNIGGSVILG